MSEASTTDGIEQLRCDLLRGLMKRDHREWSRRTAAASRAVAETEGLQPWTVEGPRLHNGGFDEYHLAVGRVR